MLYIAHILYIQQSIFDLCTYTLYIFFQQFILHQIICVFVLYYANVLYVQTYLAIKLNEQNKDMTPYYYYKMSPKVIFNDVFTSSSDHIVKCARPLLFTLNLYNWTDTSGNKGCQQTFSYCNIFDRCATNALQMYVCYQGKCYLKCFLHLL